MPQVTLHTAWLYDCDECGMENVARALPIGEEESEAMAEQLAEARYWFVVPEVVQCKFCGARFEAVLPEDDL